MSTTHPTGGMIESAKYKSGNILSYPFIAIGIYLLAHTVLLSGALFVLGGLALMPRVKWYVYAAPNVVGWGLIVAAFVTLPK